MAEIRKHTSWTEVKKEMDERDTRLAESVRRWRVQSGECGWTDDRVAACVAAHLQPAPTEGPSADEALRKFESDMGRKMSPEESNVYIYGFTDGRMTRPAEPTKCEETGLPKSQCGCGAIGCATSYTSAAAKDNHE